MIIFFNKKSNQRNELFTTNITDPNIIYKSSNISDELMSQDTFNTTNVYQRRVINKGTNLDKVNTNNNIMQVDEYQGQDQKDNTNSLQIFTSSLHE